MLRNKRTAWTAALVVLLAVAAGVAFVGLRDGGDLEPGFVAQGSSGRPPTHEADVQLPIGTLRLSSGEPLAEIAARRVGRSGAESLEAAGDASIVPVAWTFRPTLSYDDLLGYPATFTLAVTAGGERVALGEPDVDLHQAADSGDLPGQDLIAVVAGDGDDLRVEVTYEGEKQVVTMRSGKVATGRAAALYPDGPRTYGTDPDCDARGAGEPAEIANVDAGAGSISCRIDPLTRTPYLPDLGWAREGHVWTTLTVRVTAPPTISWIPTGTSYQVRREPVTAALSGAEVARAPRGDQDDRSTWVRTWVFDSPADAPADPATDAATGLTVSAPMSAVRPQDATDGPATVPFGVDQTFTLRH
ncbi:hypothetical protein [Nocardioides nitrophenolicus]|uniref:hypothetical protein n=1 Tax=Nocardioides nitrophenolicus TaxID=60489 RepID=UPI001956675F|nr:hypothetical protein [Nocardioides nitrophenolicus]MBM7519031.1 hypothetical protein [Nocardioides nitrophenolicus]